LVLIIEDDPEFREMIIAPELEKLGVRVLKADNLRKGLELASQHDPQSEDPLDLVVLDMQLPLTDKETVKPNVEAGVDFLHAYQLVDCPVIVFTAYASYENCVKSVKAGAAAYISKKKLKNGLGHLEGGLDAFLDRCQDLLREPGTPAIPPTHEWCVANSEWLGMRFPNKWVAFLEEEQASNAGLDADETRDGLALLADDSYEALRERVIACVGQVSQVPTILWARGNSGDFLDTEGEG